MDWAMKERGHSQPPACGLVGMVVRKRGGRKPALGTRADDHPARANQRWPVDFASDAVVDGQRFRVLWVIDHFTQEVSGHHRGQLNYLAARFERTGPHRSAACILGWWCPTTAPSSRPMRSSGGNRTTASTGTTSLRASPCKTGWWRALSAVA